MMVEKGSTGKESEARRQKQFARGREAEERVAKALGKLVSEGYLVLNDIEYPYGNIDHLVIRPDRTIFLIETKSHRGRVTWNGRQLLLNSRPFRSNYLCQVNRGIRWLRRVCESLFGVSPWIVAVLVFASAEVRIKCAVKRVNVMKLGWLLEFVRAYRR